jgi:hypothetical protein
MAFDKDAARAFVGAAAGITFDLDGQSLHAHMLRRVGRECQPRRPISTPQLVRHHPQAVGSL